MHLEIPVSGDNRVYRPYADIPGSHHLALTLETFVAQLKNKGKVCPKPWCWRRFYILFGPGYEPPWLSSWWSLSTQDKRDLFLKQLDYLAYQTNRFAEAHQFLLKMEEGQWVIRDNLTPDK